MAGTATPRTQNYTVDDPATYRAGIDGNTLAFWSMTDPFACHQAATPNMTVVLDAGALLIDTNQAASNIPTIVATQTTATITAPVANPRNDIVYIDRTTGAYGISAGTENASPTDPTIPVNKVAVARLRVATSTTTITNNLIDDLRVPGFQMLGNVKASSAELNGLVGTATLNQITGNMAIAAAGFNYEPVSYYVTAGAVVTLPAGSTVAAGKKALFKSITHGAVSLAPNGSDAIDGSNTSYIVPGFFDVEITSLGAGNWIITRTPQFQVGDSKESGYSSPGIGWLAENGAAVSRTTYAGLFAKIGTTFGVGDGSTTFNVPSHSGRGSIGSGTGSGLTARTLGSSGGEETHVLSISEMPSHDHAYQVGDGTPSVLNPSGNYSYTSGQNIGYLTASYNGVNAQGGGAAHNNMQPFLVKAFFIKT